MNKAGILASLIGGVATLALIAAMHDSQVALIMGMIVLVTILIGMGAMVMLSAASERRQTALPFVMSLPISYWEYTISKIAGGLLIFFALVVPAGCRYFGDDSTDAWHSSRPDSVCVDYGGGDSDDHVPYNCSCGDY